MIYAYENVGGGDKERGESGRRRMEYPGLMTWTLAKENDDSQVYLAVEGGYEKGQMCILGYAGKGWDVELTSGGESKLLSELLSKREVVPGIELLPDGKEVFLVMGRREVEMRVFKDGQVIKTGTLVWEYDPHIDRLGNKTGVDDALKHRWQREEREEQSQLGV